MGLRMKAEAAFFLIHLRVGARLALRGLAPVLAATLFLYYILRPEFALDRGIADDVLAWIGDRTAAGATVAVVSHAIEPFTALAMRALTVRDGLVEVHETLPAETGERALLLESLARGA
jgi:energy-coupling factor transporter ATP-binding protein EcfA2